MYMILQIITVRKTLSIQVLKMADDSSRWPIFCSKWTMINLTRPTYHRQLSATLKFLKGTDISTKN